MAENKGVSYAPLEKVFDRIAEPFELFIKHQTTSGILLFIAAVIAIIWANSGLAPLYYDIKAMQVGVSIGEWALNKPVASWIKDLLMAFFFFVVGLELRRELMFGALADKRKAALPLVAALGGMIVPALIYSWYNPEGPAASGWGIPMATDIAFAVGVLVMLGSRVPRGLMALLLAIAIIDDLGAIVVIALFYSSNISFEALGAAAAIIGAMYLLNQLGVRKITPYFILAMALWYAMLLSGVSPTLAGVFGAFMVPARPKYDPTYFANKSRELLGKFEASSRQNPEVNKNEELKALLHTMEHSVHNVATTSQRLEHIWHLPVAFLIVPIFALFNAGISLSWSELQVAAATPVFQGIFFGLVLGKFVGIFGFTWLAVKSGILQLPDGIRFGHVAGMSMTAGIGFTMSIFISSLAFEASPEFLTTAKAGIFAASLTAGLIGYALLWKMGASKTS